MSTIGQGPSVTDDERYTLRMRPCLRCGKPFRTTCSVRICEACHRLTDHLRNTQKVCVADLGP